MKKIRVLIAKMGLDGHDRGAKVVARALRDAGMEVIYTGLHQTANQVVDTAIQEDVDVIGLSLLSGAHMTLFKDVADLLKKKNMENILVLGGGTIPEDDRELLQQAGISEIFGPGTSTEDIVKCIQQKMRKQ
jgi:methylmalonyl-CoA mutase C-terminal domain/subunit